GRDHADAAAVGGRHRATHGGADHLDHRHVVTLPRVGQHRGGRGVAGDDQGLDAVVDEPVQALQGVLAHLGDRPGAIGGTGGVTKVEHRLVRHLVHDRPGHGETTEPGVEDAYWGILHWARLRLGPDKGVAQGTDLLDLHLDPLTGLVPP